MMLTHLGQACIFAEQGVFTVKQLNIHEAKAKLSSLVDQAARGKSFIIAKSGTPLAKLGPLNQPPAGKIKIGFMKGKITIADDFDAPLPESVLRAFEGK
jgi:prevent-host-death family protein